MVFRAEFQDLDQANKGDVGMIETTQRRLVTIAGVAGAARTMYIVGRGLGENDPARFQRLPDAIREAARRVLKSAREPECYTLKIIQRRAAVGELVIVADRTDGGQSYLQGVAVRAEIEVLDPDELQDIAAASTASCLLETTNAGS